MAVWFVMLAACIHASYSAPSPVMGRKSVRFDSLNVLAKIQFTEEFHPNWIRVAGLISILKNDTANLLDNIKEITRSVEESIKVSIYEKLDAANVQAIVNFQQTNDAVNNQSLSRRVYIRLAVELYDILDELAVNLEDDLNQLSPDIAETVTILISTVNLIYMGNVELALYKYFPIQWEDVTEKSEELIYVTMTALNQIKAVAETDNEEIGASIGAKVDNTKETLDSLHLEIIEKIDNQSLQDFEASSYVYLLDFHFMQLSIDIHEELQKLSASAAAQINEIIDSTRNAVSDHGGTLITLVLI